MAPASATARTSGPAPASDVNGSRTLWGGAPGGLGWLVAVTALIFFATAQYCQRLYVDTYFDLYAGRYVAEHGIPQRNVVTVLAHGKPWIDQQWLGQLIYYRMWQLGGYAAVVILSIALIAVGFAIFGALMLRRGASPLRMCAWTLAAFAVSFGYATPRAQSFGYLFFPLLLWLVLADNATRRPRLLTWLSIPLLAVWANVHGSVLLGAGFVGLHAAGRAWGAMRNRDSRGLAAYLLLGICAALALLCTPYGAGVVHYYGSLIGNPELAAAGTEWTPPSPAHADAWAFFAVVIAVAVAVVVGWRRGARLQPELAILGLVTLGVALLAFRNTPWFAFAGCLLAVDMLAGRVPRMAVAASFRRTIAAALTACAVIFGIGLAQTSVSQYQSWLPARPIDVAATIAGRNPGLPVLSDQWCAVGLLWLHPALFGRVAFDVRAEQYSQAQLSSIFAFMFADRPQWQRLLRGYNLVVVSRRWHPRLAAAMTKMAGWRVVYSDMSGVVVERLY
jgi:hypothetical protein